MYVQISICLYSETYVSYMSDCMFIYASMSVGTHMAFLFQLSKYLGKLVCMTSLAPDIVSFMVAFVQRLKLRLMLYACKAGG